jgi:iron complex outermembrane receptor protein
LLALIVASSVSAPAMAQAPAPDAAPAAAPGTEEIVVTAQFRSQRLQDTPIAITAMTGQMLERRSATDIVSASTAVPNVNLSRGQGGFGQFASVFIRGVGQGDVHFAVEPGVGMYIDDIYYGVMSGAVFQLLDTDRVEVSRGPQGTLSGKNSIGGSIKLYSRKPGPDPDAYVELGAGGRDYVSGRAATNLTLIPDKLYARISVAGRRRDGYLTRLDYGCVTGSTTSTVRTGADCKLGTQGGEQVWTARAALRWIINEDIENNLVIDTVQDTSENPAQKTIVQGASWAGTANYLTPAHSYTNYETYVTRPTSAVFAPPYTQPSNSPLDGKGISNTLTIGLGGGLKLASITGYRTSSVTLSAQLDQTPASIADQTWHLEHKQFTQELRLSGQIGSLLDWTVGGYYYHASGVSEGRVSIAGGVAPGGGGVNLDTVFHDPVKTGSKSAFVHGVVHATDKLSITLGGRYTRDQKDFTFNRYDAYGRPNAALLSLVDLTRTFKGDRFDYRVNVDYKFTDSVMAYAQISTGYKGGGINPRPFIASQALPFDPEELTTYEVGFKSRLFDRMLTLNGAAFYSKYKNVQGTLLRCDSISPAPGYPCTQTTNIGDADIKGLELEAQLRPTSRLSLDLSAGYLDFQYKKVVATSGVGLGMKSIYTPKLTVSAGAQYEVDLGGAGTLTPRVDYSYRSSIFTDAVNAPINRLDKLGLVNARLTWENRNKHWAVTLSATNLLDKFYYESTSLRAGVPYFSGSARLGQPRQWQVTVRRSF